MGTIKIFMKKIKIKILLFFGIFLLKSGLFCDNKIGIGLGWPYLSIKYNFLKKLSSEIRFATGEGINVYSLRGYYDFYSFKKGNFETFSFKNINLKCFSGIEAGYITFDTMEMIGNGYETSIFVGAEYFITKNFSILIDFAPTFIYLRAEDFSTEFSIDGIEIVANVALYYYFNFPFKKK